MQWLGFAASHGGITALKQFQLDALHSFNSKQDTLIIQATGSGKSLCFLIPAIIAADSDSYGILLVPTVALGESHLQACGKLKIPAVFLNGDSKKKDYELAFGATRLPGNDRPSLIILQPEILFGSSATTGVVKNLNANRLSFIAIDEVHLVFDWHTFRPAFNELKRLKELFSCPLLALTATIKPDELQKCKTSLLRTPTVIRSSVDRPNVSINISSYSTRMNSCSLENKEEKWSDVTSYILEIVKEETTIVYHAFADDCKAICASFSNLEVETAFYTGKQTFQEKQEIFDRFRKREIQILVATKAFGMGVDLPCIRHCVHIGLPENMSHLIQAFGRVGRDEKEAHGHLLFNEYLDLKKLSFWTKSMNDAEKRVRLQNFVAVYNFFSTAFAGACLRQYILRYFEDCTTEQIAPINRACCSGCEIKKTHQFEESPKIRILAQAILSLSRNRLTKIYEKQIVAWLIGDTGPDGKWIDSYFNKEDLEEQATFGVESDESKSQTKLLVRGLLRQMLALEFVSVEFELLPNSEIMTKVWSLTENGRLVAEEKLPIPNLPNPVKVVEFLSR